MTNPVMFFVELARQPLWIPVWVVLLMMVNLASVLFWEQHLSRIILVIFLVSAVIMMLMFSMVGYQRVLGLAHILWVPLLYFVLREIPVAEGGYKTYLILLAACNGMSLVFDVRDVWLHFCAND